MLSFRTPTNQFLESFIHAGAVNELKVNVHPIHSEFINSQNVKENLIFMMVS